MKHYVFALVTLILSACGTDLDGKKFREEKDNRIEAESNYNRSESYNGLLQEMLRNVTQSESMQWAYVSSQIGEPVNTYEEGEALCQSIGYDLPTREQFLGEGMTVSALSHFSGSTGIPPERFVFIKGSQDHIFGFLVCVRPIPR